MSSLERSTGKRNTHGVVLVLAFTIFSLFVVARFLVWGAQPLWGLIVVPPMSMLIVFAWLASEPDPDREV